LIEVTVGRGKRVTPTLGEKEPARTAYRRVMDALRTRLAAGEFGQADRLPSETELIAEFGVSRNTVRRAYRELAYEGLVVIRHGAGAFPAFVNVPEEPDDS
jgi:DNA-binding GntR family transcriptional regulator